MAIEIRDSVEGDLDAITRIYESAVLHGTASFELQPPDRAEMARRRAAVLERGDAWIVAVDAAGSVLGYAYASLHRPRPAYRFTAEDSIYVDPAAHRRGVGRTLLAALLERCTARGYRQMVAVIGDAGNRSSIELHRAMGFTDAGLLRSIGWKHGRWVDVVLMQRALGPGADMPPAD